MANSQNKIQKTLKPKLLDVWVSPLALRLPKIGRLILKLAFFRECDSFFQISKSQKNIFQKIILSLKLKFPASNTLLLLVGNLNFNFRIVFGNIFFSEIWRF